MKLHVDFISLYDILPSVLFVDVNNLNVFVFPKFISNRLQIITTSMQTFTARLNFLPGKFEYQLQNLGEPNNKVKEKKNDSQYSLKTVMPLSKFVRQKGMRHTSLHKLTQLLPMPFQNQHQQKVCNYVFSFLFYYVQLLKISHMYVIVTILEQNNSHLFMISFCDMKLLLRRTQPSLIYIAANYPVTTEKLFHTILYSLVCTLQNGN